MQGEFAPVVSCTSLPKPRREQIEAQEQQKISYQGATVHLDTTEPGTAIPVIAEKHSH